MWISPATSFFSLSRSLKRLDAAPTSVETQVRISTNIISWTQQISGGAREEMWVGESHTRAQVVSKVSSTSRFSEIKTIVKLI